MASQRAEAIVVGGRLRRERHRERMERLNPPAPEPIDDELLAQAEHSLQLHWLATVPGYRDAVRAKLHASIEAEIARYGSCTGCGGDLGPHRYTEGCSQCWDRRSSRKRRADVNRLDRGVEGCG
jgi:hypothetical protein